MAGLGGRLLGRRGNGIIVAASIALPMLAGAGSEARATEGGQTQYPIGADSYGVALRPPPGGAALLNYTEFYTAQIHSGSAVVGGSRVNVFVSAFRGVYTLPVSFADGTVTMTLDLVAGGGRVDAKVPTPAGTISNGSTGVIDLNPWVEINYHDGPIFATASLATWLPTGTYNKNEAPVKGLGQNHYTFAPLLYFTYLAKPNLQIDLASVTEFNTVNPHTQYTSGSDETLTASISYHVAPHLEVGPTAYYYFQFTDDKQQGTIIPKGNRSQALAVGVQGAYAIGHGALLLKYYHQTLVQNRPGGDQFWLQFAIPL